MANPVIELEGVFSPQDIGMPDCGYTVTIKTLGHPNYIISPGLDHAYGLPQYAYNMVTLKTDSQYGVSHVGFNTMPGNCGCLMVSNINDMSEADWGVVYGLAQRMNYTVMMFSDDKGRNSDRLKGKGFPAELAAKAEVHSEFQNRRTGATLTFITIPVENKGYGEYETEVFDDDNYDDYW